MADIFIKSLRKLPNWQRIDVVVQGNMPVEFWQKSKYNQFTKAQIKITYDRYKDTRFQILLSLDEYSAKVMMKYLQDIFKRRQSKRLR